MTSPWMTFGARPGSPEPTPPLASPARLILWIARRQAGRIVVSILLGMGWVLCQAVWPLLLGAAVESATHGFRAELFPPLAALAGLAVTQSLFGTFNYRSSYSNYLRTTASLARLVGRRITATGRAATRERGAGELVVTATSDAVRVGRVFDVVPRLVGAVVAWLLVTALLFASATALGFIALFGVPISCAVLALLVRPLERTQAEQRGKLGLLSAIGSDAAAGLRILRGIGGEDEFVARYRSQSQTVRRAGVRIAGVQSWLGGAQVLLPSVTIALVVGTGATLVLGGDWTAGELVTAYGYSAFLILPISTGVEAVATLTGGVVGARRILDVLRVQPPVRDDGDSEAPPAGAELRDEVSGLTVRPGLFTAVVADRPDESAALADRLGRYDDAGAAEAPVRWGSVDQAAVPLAEVRRRIVVSGATAQLFSGPLLDSLHGTAASTLDREAAVRRAAGAVRTAVAEDVLEARPDGWDHVVDERGRSFSGGERQRLSLARALLTEAEILVLVEPTSAVDARTEQLIGERLAAAREGRTTVVMTASPLLLRHAHTVALLHGGRVVAEGRHDELLGRTDDVGRQYRSLVLRGEEADDAAARR